MKYILLFLPFLIHAQLRPQIDTLASSIATYGRITGSEIGYNSEHSAQYDRFGLLDSLASTNELKLLLDRDSPAIKAASFAALSKRDTEYCKPILEKSLYSSLVIRAQYGCIIENEKLGDIFIRSFFYGLISQKNDTTQATKNYTTHLFKRILNDSLISLNIKTSLVRGLEPNDENYTLLKKLAASKKEPYALITLSKYKREEDKAIIISYLTDKVSDNKYYGTWAVRNFPDEAFYPYLVNQFKTMWKKRRYSFPLWRILYQALVQYPDKEETQKLFKRTTTTLNKTRKNYLSHYLLLAATKYPHPSFTQYTTGIHLDRLASDFFEEEMALQE